MIGIKKITKEKMSSSLEDYLETIFELVRDNKLARVKDIAKARNVRAASVTPAMKRLSRMGLIKYTKREFIDLTAEGEKIARRIYARHKILIRFLNKVLQVPPGISKDDACAMEHSLSDVSMNHLVKFFEFLNVCPEGKEFLDKFHSCSVIHDNIDDCKTICDASRKKIEENYKLASVKQLKPGEKGRVARIEGKGAIRQRLLDMGIMPDVIIEMERVSPAGDPVWVKFQGTQLSLRKNEAGSILVSTESEYY